MPPSSPSSSGGNAGAILPLAVAFLGGITATLGLQLLSRCTNKNANATAEAELWKMVQHSFSAALIRAGDKLDIYEKLYQAKSISAAQLAHQNGWSERWLREFLLQSAGAGICSFEQRKTKDATSSTYAAATTTNLYFSLNPGYAKFLRPPSQERKSLAGMFQFLLPLLNRSDAVVRAIQTGVGVNYDWGDGGDDDVSLAIDRKNRNWFTYNLVDDLLANIVLPSSQQSLLQMLDSKQSCAIADVGCGCGASSIAMAKRFPNCHIYAYESSDRAIQIFKQRIQQEGLTNITICDVSKRTVGDGPKVDDPESTFDFVYAHDVLHDMTHPRELIKDVYQRLSKAGCWVVVDVDCDEDLATNLAKPNSATVYGFSCLLCLASSSSSKGGEALGTCGFPTSLARRWMKRAGFRHFVDTTVRTTLPHNSCFVIAK